MFGETARVWSLIILFALAPAISFAAAGLPTQIVPCSGAVARDGLPACTICHIAELAQNLLNSAIFLAVFMSAILFAYAGWLYLTNEALQGQSEARGLFKDVVMGLIVILGAWLVIDTLMKTVSGGQYFPWNSVCGG
jgi:hypothetical protein